MFFFLHGRKEPSTINILPPLSYVLLCKYENIFSESIKLSILAMFIVHVRTDGYKQESTWQLKIIEHICIYHLLSDFRLIQCFATVCSHDGKRRFVVAGREGALSFSLNTYYYSTNFLNLSSLFERSPSHRDRIPRSPLNGFFKHRFTPHFLTV